MEAGVAHRLVQFSITAAASNTFVLFGRGDPARANINPTTLVEIRPGGSIGPIHPQGRLRGVAVRLHTGGGWTFASGRIRICQPRDPLLDPFTALTYPTVVAEATRVLYDSGVLAAGAFVASAADAAPMLLEEFGANYQRFDGWLATAIEWTTSAGAGTSTIDVTLDTEDDN